MKDIPDVELEQRCGYADKMTVEEQCANIFYIRSWYGKYERLCELNKTDTMGCYTDEIANMENVMEEARALWDKKWKKTITERVQSMTDMIR